MRYTLSISLPKPSFSLLSSCPLLLVAVLELPACIEHGVDEAPIPCALAVKVQLRAEEIESTPVDVGRHRTWIPEELTDVEAAVADEALWIDRQPVGSVRSQDVVVVQVAMQRDGFSGGIQEVLPHGVCTLEQRGRELVRAARQGGSISSVGVAPGVQWPKPCGSATGRHSAAALRRP